ncbi:hypothetical protein BBD40_03090 [Paenibacillus ihbetae]|uniref:Uncharacterized protein n=1 Tax=Paenibacillus ihbetae TaxID=1870820 RepID=A0ABX3JVP6_9BACL|nr:hypothetical protein BBD40_03090 [Paenibacillus ihbetae]
MMMFILCRMAEDDLLLPISMESCRSLLEVCMLIFIGAAPILMGIAPIFPIGVVSIASRLELSRTMDNRHTVI